MTAGLLPTVVIGDEVWVECDVVMPHNVGDRLGMVILPDLKIDEVALGSEAQKCGIEVGMILIGVDGRRVVTDAEAVDAVLTNTGPAMKLSVLKRHQETASSRARSASPVPSYMTSGFPRPHSPPRGNAGTVPRLLAQMKVGPPDCGSGPTVAEVEERVQRLLSVTACRMEQSRFKARGSSPGRSLIRTPGTEPTSSSIPHYSATPGVTWAARDPFSSHGCNAAPSYPQPRRPGSPIRVLLPEHALASVGPGPVFNDGGNPMPPPRRPAFDRTKMHELQLQQESMMGHHAAHASHQQPATGMSVYNVSSALRGSPNMDHGISAPPQSPVQGANNTHGRMSPSGHSAASFLPQQHQQQQVYDGQSDDRASPLFLPVSQPDAHDLAHTQHLQRRPSQPSQPPSRVSSPNAMYHHAAQQDSVQLPMPRSSFAPAGSQSPVRVNPQGEAVVGSPSLAEMSQRLAGARPDPRLMQSAPPSHMSLHAPPAMTAAHNSAPSSARRSSGSRLLETTARPSQVAARFAQQQHRPPVQPHLPQQPPSQRLVADRGAPSYARGSSQAVPRRQPSQPSPAFSQSYSPDHSSYTSIPRPDAHSPNDSRGVSQPDSPHFNGLPLPSSGAAAWTVAW
ncbi:hypothetical protein DIPPA_34381 [Diplonema papillatum]|nr:hypothetical protein DIPPA_34381 [Diplonema papillatum]